MKLECIQTCVNYGDILAETLPHNLPYFDHIVVVTHPDDKETQAVCDRYSVDCVKTTVMHHDGEAFNKGRMINLGLAHLKGLDWILHLDADIVLPHRFRDMLYRHGLKKHCLYGADRANVIGYDHWHKHKHKTTPHHSSNYFVEAPKEFPIGARIIHPEHNFCPIGFFQLWNKAAHKKYPVNQGTAEHTDVLFAAQWPREDRHLLPEVIVYHLESESLGMGANWKQRKTKRWGCCKGSGPSKGYCP